MRATSYIVALLGALAVCAVGCNNAVDTTAESEKTPTSVALATTNVDASRAAPKLATDEVKSTGDVQRPKPQSDEVASLATAQSPTIANAQNTESASPEDFNPPFPGRTDLFAPPNRANRSAASSNRSSRAVALQGFVNVDELRAVLNIDGQVSPIREGDERFGVQVIAIQPPKVVLQRGRERWTEVLEN